MAKPRIFLSSTFYDLKQIRLDLDRFIRDLGYEPIRHEIGNIPYGKDDKLEEYCYKEINSIDIMVSIIGGRYGAQSAHIGYSISQMEINQAIKLDKQLFILIDKNVYSEFRTYQLNKTGTIKYHYVDNSKIYEFIEFLESLPRNNPIQTFESSEDIISFLKEQWSGLFQRFLQEQRRQREQDFLQGLSNTATTLNQLINYLTEEKKGSEATMRDIVISNHPIFEHLRKLCKVPYRLFFLNRTELGQWLTARGFQSVDSFLWDVDDMEEWSQIQNKNAAIVRVSTTLFTPEGALKPMTREQWSDNLLTLTNRALQVKQPVDSDDDLPF